jgi:hypothetical protein
MRCPICDGDFPQFRQHALQHIIADEAYGIEVFDRDKGASRLTLHPILGRLSKERLKELRQQYENATTTVLHRHRLVLAESRRKSLK